MKENVFIKKKCKKLFFSIFFIKFILAICKKYIIKNYCDEFLIEFLNVWKGIFVYSIQFWFIVQYLFKKSSQNWGPHWKINWIVFLKKLNKIKNNIFLIAEEQSEMHLEYNKKKIFWINYKKIDKKTRLTKLSVKTAIPLQFFEINIEKYFVKFSIFNYLFFSFFFFNFFKK